MKGYLVFSIILCIFAKWIDGSREPLTRVFQQPFHLANLLESLNVGKEMKRLTTEDFISRARKVHGDKYDYSKVDYKNAITKVCIICPIHGEFWQRPFVHLKGQGCAKCCFESMWVTKRHKRTTEEYISLAKNIHGDKYDYSKTKYEHSFKKVCVVCKTHGDFYVHAFAHLKGYGCPHCAKSKGEEKIATILKAKNIPFERQKKFNNDNLFCRNKYFEADFYLPQKNIIIEYNGRQHYEAIDIWGGEPELIRQQERDMALRQYCKEHGIRLIEIPHWETDKIEEIIKSI